MSLHVFIQHHNARGMVREACHAFKKPATACIAVYKHPGFVSTQLSELTGVQMMVFFSETQILPSFTQEGNEATQETILLLGQGRYKFLTKRVRLFILIAKSDKEIE